MELKRIFSDKKMIFLTLLLLFVTAGLFLWREVNNFADNCNLTDKIEYKNELENISASHDDRETYEIFCSMRNEIYGEQAEDSGSEVYYISDYRIDVLDECISQLEYISSYDEYLTGILENSDSLSSISIFQNAGSFSSLNLEKTKADYEKIQDVKVSYGNYSAVTAVMNYDFIHYIIFIFMFIVAWSFFEDDKKGLKTIFYAARNGRIILSFHRIGVLLATSLAFTSAAYALTFLCGFALYGGTGYLGNSIQSVKMFKDCLFNVDIIRYIFIYILIHASITFVMSLFVWMILLIFRNRLLSLGFLIIVIGAEAVLNAKLISQSAVVFLKYENLFCLINPVGVINSYRNYMMFGHIVNCYKTFAATVIILGVVCAAVCCAISAKRRPVSGKTKFEIILLKILKKINAAYCYIIAKLSVTGMEMYKVVVVHRGIIFVAVWLYLLISAVDTTSVTFMGTGALMQEVYDEYSGSVGDELTEYANSNNEILEEAYAEYKAAMDKYDAGGISEDEFEKANKVISQYESLESIMTVVNEKLEYIDNIKEEKGIDAWFIYDKGYKVLWTGDGLYTGSGYGAQETKAVFAVMLLVLLLGMVFSYDKSCGMYNVIHATRYGRKKLFYKKIKMAGMFCLFICIVTYGLEIYEVNAVYPLVYLNAPVQSLTFMSGFPFRISILAFLIMVEVIHFVCLFAVGMIIYMFSALFKGYYGIILSLAALVTPSLLFMLGVEWCEYISATQPIIYVEALVEHGTVYSFVSILALTALGAGCFMVTKRKFCK